MWLKAIFPQQNIAMSVLFSISQFAKIEMNNIFQFQCKEEKYTKLKFNIWNPEGQCNWLTDGNIVILTELPASQY